MGREAQRLHYPLKTQWCCELGNRTKMGWETDRRHLLVKSQCFAQFGIRSAACRVMFPQQSLETKGCENIRERDIVVVDLYQLILVWVLRLVHSLCVYSFSWWCHQQVPRCRSHGIYHPSTTKPPTNFPCLLGKINKSCQPPIKTAFLSFLFCSKVTVKQKKTLWSPTELWKKKTFNLDRRRLRPIFP